MLAQNIINMLDMRNLRDSSITDDILLISLTENNQTDFRY
jgi:hypothetical protein